MPIPWQCSFFGDCFTVLGKMADFQYKNYGNYLKPLDSDRHRVTLRDSFAPPLVSCPAFFHGSLQHFLPDGWLVLRQLHCPQIGPEMMWESPR
jgi:hypothetical protein